MDEKMIDIHIVKNQAEFKQVLEIRKQVFVKGQNVSIEREQDGLDDSSEHIILFYNKKPVGTTRIRYKNNKIKLERIAIFEKNRGKGLGIKLIEFLINYGKEKKVNEIYIHSQYYLLKFYSKFGFKQRGKIFYDANIKHIEMYIKL